MLSIIFVKYYVNEYTIILQHNFCSLNRIDYNSTLTNRLIPVAFALLPHTSEQVRRSAHAVLHSLLAHAPVSLAQSLVPSYCRIALTSAMVDDVPVPSTNNSQSADYLYER